MSTVRLPFQRPPIFGYQFYAFPLGIIAVDPRSRDWLLSNFIQVAYDPAGRAADVPFCFYLHDPARNPWMESIVTSREWLAAGGTDIERAIRGSIDAGFYVYLDLDEYYVPQRPVYRQEHRPHDLLIHGYDDHGGVLWIVGFTDAGRIESTPLPAAALREGYESPQSHTSVTSRVHFYRPATTSYPLDIGFIRQGLTEYLDSADTSVHFAEQRTAWDRVYGLRSYEPLAAYLDAYVAEDEGADVRDLHILYEHKLLMTMRVKRLAEVVGGDWAELIVAAEHLERTAVGVRNLMLVSMNRGDPARMAPARDVLADLRTADAEFVEALLERLQDTSRIRSGEIGHDLDG